MKERCTQISIFSLLCSINHVLIIYAKLASFPAFMTTCLLINEQKLMKLSIIRGFRFLYQKIGGMQQSEAKVMLLNL